MHRDHHMRQELSKRAATNRRAFSFFRSSHEFSKLTTLIYTSTPVDKVHVVQDSNLVDSISKDLFFEDRALILEEAESSLKRGYSIGFLRATSVSGQYEITSRVNSGSAMEKALLKKWLNSQIQSDLQKQIDKGREEVQSKYYEVKSKRPSLDKY